MGSTQSPSTGTGVFVGVWGCCRWHLCRRRRGRGCSRRRRGRNVLSQPVDSQRDSSSTRSAKIQAPVFNFSHSLSAVWDTGWTTRIALVQDSNYCICHSRPRPEVCLHIGLCKVRDWSRSRNQCGRFRRGRFWDYRDCRRGESRYLGYLNYWVTVGSGYRQLFNTVVPTSTACHLPEQQTATGTKAA